jgi:hypothetical protein
VSTTRLVTRGFEAFRRGTFGNGGQNLYVSRAGVLQRIHQYDFDGDGRMDLVISNSQNHFESPPAFVYRSPGGATKPVELPADGAWTAEVCDLDGDGLPDLVMGMWENGVTQELNAIVYYGTPEGWSERATQRLPVPACTSVAAGDFDGDGRPELAFASRGTLRVFPRTPFGFEPAVFTCLEVSADQISAADLDGDGYADLVVRAPDGRVTIYWGSRSGLDLRYPTAVPVPVDPLVPPARRTFEDCTPDAHPLVRILRTPELTLFVARATAAHLVPVLPARRLGPSLELPCVRPMSAAVADIDGDGRLDLVLAAREPADGSERSWVYWGGDGGYRPDRRTGLPSYRACDVAAADADGDGIADVALCQSHTAESYTSECLLYRGSRDRSFGEPARLLSHDARRVFLAPWAHDTLPAVTIVNARARGMLGQVKASIFLWGDDGFTPERRIDLPGQDSVEALCADLDDDGRADVLLANCSENAIWRDPGSFVYLNGPSGFPTDPSYTLPTTRAHGVCCADFDRDGYLDLVFSGFDNPELLLFRGRPGGFDTVHPTRIRLVHEGTEYREPRWITVADLDGDGWLDLIVPLINAERSFVLWGGPDGFSMERATPFAVRHAACARVADLDGDGRPEIVFGGHTPSVGGPHDSFIYIYWNTGRGFREERRTLLPGKAVNSIALADFDNDGMLDLFACSYHDGRERDVDSFIYWNRRGRGFSVRDFTRIRTHSASACMAADWNGDGWIDLAVANHKVEGDHLGWSAVHWNGPDGFSPERVTVLPSSGPHGMSCVPPGNMLDRGPEEHYTSAPEHVASGQARVRAVGWKGELPPWCWVRAQVRSAPTEAELEGASWEGCFDGTDASAPVTMRGEWLQYRLALGTKNACGTPRVTEVHVEIE